MSCPVCDPKTCECSIPSTGSQTQATTTMEMDLGPPVAGRQLLLSSAGDVISDTDCGNDEEEDSFFGSFLVAECDFCLLQNCSCTRGKIARVLGIGGKM
jgi:hypothetical protein